MNECDVQETFDRRESRVDRLNRRRTFAQHSRPTRFVREKNNSFIYPTYINSIVDRVTVLERFSSFTLFPFRTDPHRTSLFYFRVSRHGAPKPPNTAARAINRQSLSSIPRRRNAFVSQSSSRLDNKNDNLLFGIHSDINPLQFQS